MRVKITQNEMAAIVLLEAEIVKLKAAEAQHKKLSAEMLKRLKRGDGIEDGALRAINKPWQRTVISWLDIVKREMGDAFVTRVTAATKPSDYDKLVIEPAINVGVEVAAVTGTVTY